MLPQDSASNGSQPTAQAWDPYDVWLNRVKLPRERQPQRVAAVAEIHAAAVNEARSPGPSTDGRLLLPGIS